MPKGQNKASDFKKTALPKGGMAVGPHGGAGVLDPTTLPKPTMPPLGRVEEHQSGSEVNSAAYVTLAEERIYALFREDVEFALRWGSIQMKVQVLLADLEQRGWDATDRAFALQSLLRSIVAQVEQREAEK